MKVLKSFKYNLLFALFLLSIDGQGQKADLPNIIIIYADDLGYGDLGSYGSTVHKTPNIDKMTSEGIYFTGFYSASPFCTPSRASLLTGSYAKRVNMAVDVDGYCVVFPVGKKGLNPKEINIANHLKKSGYNTACIGKWHLGDQQEFLPNNQGFDYYFGLPYSNDTGPEFAKDNNFDRVFPPIPLVKNTEVIEAPIDQRTLTQRYTEEAITYIEKNSNTPFFLYLAHTMPHYPPNASESFRGKSNNGLYGDSVEEMDWSTGKIIQTLERLKLDKNTLVVFTSDNGAATHYDELIKGSNKPLRGWKGSTFEGGMRVPFVAWWPGRIKPGTTTDELATTMDLLPSISSLVNNPLPKDHKIDGKNILPLLFNEPNATSQYEVFYYYLREQLQAVRKGKWKLHLPLKKACKGCWKYESEFRPTALYNLETDLSESIDLKVEYPNVVEELSSYAELARKDLGDGERKGESQRVAGYIKHPVPLEKKD